MELKEKRKSGLSAWISQAIHNLKYVDYGFIAILILLLGYGLIMLYSASYYSAELKFGNDMYYFNRQAIFSVFSILVMLFVSVFDYRRYIRYAGAFLLFSYLLMLLVLSPLGVERYGARRWLNLGITFQPSEIAKIAIVLFIPWFIVRLGKNVNKLSGAVRVLLVAAVTSAIIFFATDHLSTAIVVFGMVYIMLAVASRWTVLYVAGAGLGIAGSIAGVYALANRMTTSANFRLRRLLVWLDPESYADSGGYQIIQGLYAIGSGGFFGKGLGNSSQKLGYIPEAQNDMILTIICEELGIFGVTLLLLMFSLLLYRLVRIAREAVDEQGGLIVVGIFAHIALQVILNICVVLNLIPATGITLPFISYGGTAVVFLMAEMGVALSVGARSKMAQERELRELDAMGNGVDFQD